MLNRIERDEMEYYKKYVQTDLRSALPEEMLKYLEKKKKPKSAVLGKVFMAPKSWKGSIAYMREKYADTMAIARTVGNPTWYLYIHR
jgi:hypothetical protein